MFKNPSLPYSGIWSRIHPPENRNLDRTWHFKFWLPQFTPPHWNLDRTWHFKFWLPQFTLPPQKIEIWSGLGTTWHVEFWLPPSPRVSGSSYVETNFCIPRGYHLVQLLANPRQGAWTRALWGPISFIIMQFSGKKWLSNSFSRPS